MIPRPFRLRLLGVTHRQLSARPASSWSLSSRKATSSRTSDVAPKITLTAPSTWTDSRSRGFVSATSLGHSTSSGSQVTGTRSMHTFASRSLNHGRRRRRALSLAAAREKQSIASSLSSRPEGSSRFMPLPRRSSPEAPILSSPVQAAKHVKATPSHLPLPIPLGNDIYDLSNVLDPSSVYGSELPPSIFGERGYSIWSDRNDPQALVAARREEAFEDLLAEMQDKSGGAATTLTGHLNILAALDPVDLAPQTRTLQEADADLKEDEFEPSELQSLLRDKQTRYNIESQMEWNKILAHLGDKSVKLPSDALFKSFSPQDLSTLEMDQSLQVKDAISNLFSTLKRIDPGHIRGGGRLRNRVLRFGGRHRPPHPETFVEVSNSDNGETMLVSVMGDEHGRTRYSIIGDEEGDAVYQMTSVVRKRRLKIKKHKYKKRRKAQRALRRRLGK
ncbi:hypothetical protein BD324DRAFT_614493 [Kockovaella imperatae]|uniref:Ribosomal protein mS38 C-terminal domain-containing protein n=1 Tax=Kockovaella imperatae TaxID=4999 RepID=A0A1Y1UNL8_9TREE|nr:hypothetical protein BD324DRAFT_614493 [Kockovaella imperatae]ORX39650.1 hypothetical protein BD324DRAFT_614493 [Kockovaella imperatae]